MVEVFPLAIVGRIPINFVHVSTSTFIWPFPALVVVVLYHAVVFCFMVLCVCSVNFCTLLCSARSSDTQLSLEKYGGE